MGAGEHGPPAEKVDPFQDEVTAEGVRELRVDLAVELDDVVVARDEIIGGGARPLVLGKNGDHRELAVGDPVHGERLEQIVKACAEFASPVGGWGTGVVLGDVSERGDACGGRERVGIVRAGVLHLFAVAIVEGERFHEVGATGEAAPRKTTREDFGEGDQVGFDAVDLLGTAGSDAESGDDFIENQEDAVAIAKRADPREKLAPHGDEAPVAARRFEDDAGGLVSLEGLFESREVVGGNDDQVAEHVVGDAGHAIVARVVWRIGRRDELVVPAVEVAGEFDRAGASGNDAGDALGHQGRFGAAAGEADLFRGGHQAANRFGPFHFEGVAGAEVGTFGDLGLNGFDEGGMAVSENERTVAHPVVDDFAAFDRPFAGALGPLDVDGKRGEIATVVGDAAGEGLGPAAGQCLGLGECGAVIGEGALGEGGKVDGSGHGRSGGIGAGRVRACGASRSEQSHSRPGTVLPKRWRGRWCDSGAGPPGADASGSLLWK